MWESGKAKWNAVRGFSKLELSLTFLNMRMHALMLTVELVEVCDSRVGGFMEESWRSWELMY